MTLTLGFLLLAVGLLPILWRLRGPIAIAYLLHVMGVF